MVKNIRFYILLVSVVFSLAVYGWAITTIPQGSVQIIRLTQIYALTAIIFLYFALLAGPLCSTLQQLPFLKHYLHARRALGVAAFYFASLHSCVAFFWQLGGFEGVGFLSDKYLLAIVFSFTALVILFLMAITSFDVAVKRLAFIKWKLLHRFVYLAGIFILIHALMLGTHFRTISEFIPQIFFSALAVLVFLEALRFDSFLQEKFENLPRFGLTTTLVVGFVIVSYGYSLLPFGATLPLGIHSQHIKMAKDAQQSANITTNLSNFPSMNGDKTKRYTTGFFYDKTVQPNQETTMSFPVYDASSGKRVEYFKTLYEKPAHLIIVDSTLTYFNHIHPKPTESEFIIITQFPKAGAYHLYLDYQPLGAIEQQVAFTVNVGAETGEKSNIAVDKNFTKTFGEYQVSLDFPNPLKAQRMSVGQQLLTFTIKDNSGKPITTLKPYLASYGHLVMINRDTYEYLHVHPTNVMPPKPDEDGGPEVTFMPFGLYGPIKPGTYRVFGQFSPDGKLFTADFTVEVK